jgi:hypothetical protein
MGYVYKDGQWNEAEAVITEVNQKEILGADHSDTLTSMNNLVST